MPFEIDQAALESPNMTILDIHNPPTKHMAHQPFPKMVYLHPKDKTAQHLSKIVQNPVELEQAEAEGWKTTPHIPEEGKIDLSAFHTEEKRGPGRPRLNA